MYFFKYQIISTVKFYNEKCYYLIVQVELTTNTYFYVQGERCQMRNSGKIITYIIYLFETQTGYLQNKLVGNTKNISIQIKGSSIIFIKHKLFTLYTLNFNVFHNIENTINSPRRNHFQNKKLKIEERNTVICMYICAHNLDFSFQVVCLAQIIVQELQSSMRVLKLFQKKLSCG